MQATDLSLLRELSTALLSDVMDSLGLMGQAMRPFVRPLDENQILIGYARTGLYMPAYSVRPGENPYDVEIALVDDLKQGEVPVLACAGPTERIAPWGELLTTASQARGAAGCVTDGLVRDVRQIRAPATLLFSTAESGRWTPRAEPAWWNATFQWNAAAYPCAAATSCLAT